MTPSMAEAALTRASMPRRSPTASSSAPYQSKDPQFSGLLTRELRIFSSTRSGSRERLVVGAGDDDDRLLALDVDLAGQHGCHCDAGAGLGEDASRRPEETPCREDV